MIHPEEICATITAALTTDSFSYYYGTKPDQNFEADEFTYPVVFLDKPIQARIKNTITNVRESTVDMKLLFAYLAEIDATEPEKFENMKRSAWNAAREFVLRLREYADIKDVTNEFITDVDHVFDINLVGCFLEVTVVIVDANGTCLDVEDETIVSPPVTPEPPVVYDVDAQAYFDALPDPMSDARKTIINDLFVTLKADGNFEELDRLWLFANETEDNALVSLANPDVGIAINVNNMSFVVDEGFHTSAGTYIDTVLPLDAATKFTVNSNSHGQYQRHPDSGADSGTDSGASKIGYTMVTYMIHKYTDNNTYDENNCVNTAPMGAALTRDGFHVSKRTNAISQEYWKNGVLVHAVARNSSGRPPCSLFIPTLNLEGTSTGTMITPQNYSVKFIGSGNINQLTFYNAIQTYMTAIGKQV